MTVYFVECAGRIKIGYAKDVKDRLKALSTGSAHNLTLLGAIDGSVHYERAIHKRLKHLRQRGEWFEDCKEVRDLLTLLQTNGPLAIGFSEPPVPEKHRPQLQDEKFWESPLRPVMTRIDACMDRYVGTQIAASLKQETALGLEKGTLVNKRLGGHYTSERARVAFVLIRNTMDAVEGLTSIVFETIFDPDTDPVDQATIVLPATKCVERLERGLATLFASPSLETLDMSGYASQ